MRSAWLVAYDATQDLGVMALFSDQPLCSENFSVAACTFDSEGNNIECAGGDIVDGENDCNKQISFSLLQTVGSETFNFPQAARVATAPNGAPRLCRPANAAAPALV